MFDFSKVEAAKEQAKLQPGLYNVTITDATFTTPEGKKPDGSSKTPFVDVTFTTENGGSITVPFYITEKAFGRIQYLHTSWFGAACTKSFATVQEIGQYFEKLLKAKGASFNRVLSVVGVDNGNNVYPDIPYTGFIVENTDGIDLGAYAPGSDDYKRAIRFRPNAATTSKETVINRNETKSESFTDDLPF